MNSNAAANWPDWSGQTAIIIGTGPSASFDPLQTLRKRVRAIAIKTSWLLAPWADALYGSDREWWVANRGVPDFNGLKLSASPSACRVYKVRQITPKPGAKILVGETGVVGAGLPAGDGHSGFQALNLAVQFGAKRVILFGFDMTLKDGAHWHEATGAAALTHDKVSGWRQALDACAPEFARLGVEVLNCSARSALTAYPKVEFHELTHLLSLSPAAHSGDPVGGVRDRVAS